MANKTEVKLPESLEVVAYLAAIQAALTAGADSAWYTHPRDANRWRENEALAHACHPDYMKPILEHVSRVESALKARDAEIERLRGVINDHNADCESQCEQRQQSGDSHCPYAKYDLQCPDCPRDGMLDPSAIDQARAEGGEKTNGL